MLKADLYNFEGKKKEDSTLPKKYDVKPNINLLTQAVHVYEDRGHFGLARVKTRGEVTISTRKIYRQKGTGGARHGAKSAPIFVGGGVAHGPKGNKRILRLSSSQKSKALLSALSYKFAESRVVLVEGIDKIKKTKDAADLIKNIVKDKSWKNGKNIFVALSADNDKAVKFFRNVNGIVVDQFKNLNAYKVYLAGGLLIDKKAFEEKKESKEARKEEKVAASTTSRISRKSGGINSKTVKTTDKQASRKSIKVKRATVKTATGSAGRMTGRKSKTSVTGKSGKKSK